MTVEHPKSTSGLHTYSHEMNEWIDKDREFIHSVGHSIVITESR